MLNLRDKPRRLESSSAKDLQLDFARESSCFLVRYARPGSERSRGYYSARTTRGIYVCDLRARGTNH